MPKVQKIFKRKKDRRPKEVRDAEDRLKRHRKWLDCKVCKVNGGEVDGSIVSFTCSTCTALGTAPPAETTNAPIQKHAKYKESFPRGWWRRIVFSGEHEGETLFFSRGVSITKAEHKKLVREQDAL